MMRHRPTERKAILALLDQEWEDIDALCESILDTLLEIKWHRGGWIVVHLEHGRLFAWGPYDTANQAQRDIGKRIVASGPGAKAIVIPVKNMDTWAASHGDQTALEW